MERRRWLYRCAELQNLLLQLGLYHLGSVCKILYLELPVFGLRLVGGGSGGGEGGARQGAKISEIGAQILGNRCFLKKTSRDPVGHQFSSFWHHVWTCREAAKITQKRAKTLQTCCFFMNLAASRHWCRLDPDWIHGSARTHSRTYFPLPRPTLAPIFLFRAPAVHQYPSSCTKTAKAVLSQTGVLQPLYIYK